MSAVLPLPVLRYIEGHSDPRRIIAYNTKTWSVCLYVTAIYLLLVFQGRRWMKHRKPFKLRRPLFLWNVGLAVFSIFGTAAVLPSVLHSFYYYGVDYTVCFSDGPTIPRFAIWCYIFGLSKILELGDTAFIVLRKGPLPFLHWYHHVTVLIYTIYGINDPNALGAIFSGMNYFVHSLMYSYYALRANGIGVPRWAAQAITLLQLSQMFVGVFVTLRAFYNDRSGRVPGCTVKDDVFFMATVMYFSYAVLFIHFFYKKYCGSRNTKSH